MRHLKIGAHTYNLILTSDIDDCGSTEMTTRKIRLNATMPPTVLESTLLHEAMHVMNTSISHPLLDSLAEQIYSFLKENRLLDEKRLSKLLCTTTRTGYPPHSAS